MTRHERMVEALDMLERAIDRRAVTLIRRINPQNDDLDIAYIKKRILAILAEAEADAAKGER